MLYGPGLALVGYFSCLVLSYLTLSCPVHLFGEVSPLSLPFPDQEKNASLEPEYSCCHVEGSLPLPLVTVGPG